MTSNLSFFAWLRTKKYQLLPNSIWPIIYLVEDILPFHLKVSGNFSLGLKQIIYNFQETLYDFFPVKNYKKK